MGIGSECPKTLVSNFVLVTKGSKFLVVPTLCIESVLKKTRFHFCSLEEVCEKLRIVAITNSKSFYFSIFYKLFKSSPNLQCVS